MLRFLINWDRRSAVVDAGAAHPPVSPNGVLTSRPRLFAFLDLSPLRLNNRVRLCRWAELRLKAPPPGRSGTLNGPLPPQPGLTCDGRTLGSDRFCTTGAAAAKGSRIRTAELDFLRPSAGGASPVSTRGRIWAKSTGPQLSRPLRPLSALLLLLLARLL